MPLPSSGQITLNQVNVELGLSGTAQIGLGDSATRTLFDVASGQISMSNGYGKANVFTLTFSSHTADPDISSLATAAGWDGSTELVVQVNSGIYVYSTDDNTSLGFGLHANVPCTINNYGNIIGKGGIGGANYAGAQALKISSSGVTVINHSGAYIAGGGGGGNGALAGGGAGGGNGSGYSGQGGAGGAAGAAGSDGTSSYGSYYIGHGGGAGGGAGGINTARSTQYHGGGGGGGRIVPGTGGTGGAGGSGKGGDGGSANSDGQGGLGPVGVAGQWQRQTSGGGGGWAATGGFENGIDGSGPIWDHPGGVGGPAISASTSYTLTNNGTIYGST